MPVKNPDVGAQNLALGLFHFNIQYVAGHEQGYHRYCTQAIIPFLETFAIETDFSATFELAGCGVEFLCENYPDAFGLLKSLVNCGRIEVISSTYAPTIWVAFPQRDLLASIEINRERLNEIGIAPSPLFFSQEAFFGRGLMGIASYFEAALCKDEYINHFTGLGILNGIYSLNGFRTVVGSNHLLNEVTSICNRHPSSGVAVYARKHFGRHLERATKSISGFRQVHFSDEESNLSWMWYHMGSGHHFACPNQPDDFSRFYTDESWLAMNVKALKFIQESGYRLSTISTLLKQTRGSADPDLPFMPEGSWNAARSGGVRTWMNLNERTWDQNYAILAAAWRSREILMKCDRMVDRTDHSNRAAFTKALKELWAKQIMAESSDSCGWRPLPVEVKFGLSCAEEVFIEGSMLAAKMSASVNFGLLSIESTPNEEPPPDDVAALQSKYIGSLVGAIGDVDIVRADSVTITIKVDAVTSEATAGIHFPMDSLLVHYCPSGAERELVPFRWLGTSLREIYLPLANGLLMLGAGVFLIRINAFGQPSARLIRDEDSVAFEIYGASSIKRVINWRFVLYFGCAKDAIIKANALNDI